MDSKDGSNESAEMCHVSTWNYRVVRRDGYLAIHEAYYDDSGNVRSLTIDAVSPAYEDLADLKTNLELMLEATEEDILDYDDG